VLQVLGSAQARIIVVGLSLPTFTTEGALRTYSRVLAQGVKIDLILVNPMSPTLLQRPRRLYLAYQGVMVTSASSLRALLKFRAHIPPEQRDSFRVRLTNSLPTAATIIVDNRCLWHPYLLGVTGASSPYIEELCTEGFGPNIVRNVETLIESHTFEPDACDAQYLVAQVETDDSIKAKLPIDDARAVRRALSL
jgi:hypothetical protein